MVEGYTRDFDQAAAVPAPLPSATRRRMLAARHGLATSGGSSRGLVSAGAGAGVHTDGGGQPTDTNEVVVDSIEDFVVVRAGAARHVLRV